MNFKTPFKVLTTAALIGTLSLSAVAPGVASAADKTVTAQAETPANFALEKVILVKGDSKISVSFDTYIDVLGNEKALNGYELAYVVAANGEVFALDTYVDFYEAGNTEEEVVEKLSKAGKTSEVTEVKDGAFNDGKLEPVEDTAATAKADLEKAVAAAKATEIKDAAAKAELTKAIEAAEKAAAKEDATKEELEAAKAELTKAVAAAKKADEEAALEAKVESVTAINGTTLEVKFNKAVKASTLYNASSKVIDSAALTVTGGDEAVTAANLKGSLSEDAKTLTITVDSASEYFDGTYTVKVIADKVALKDKATAYIPAYTGLVTASDTKAPELDKVTYKGSEATVDFTEALAAEGTVSLDGVALTKGTGYTFSAKDKAIVVKNLEAGKKYELTVVGAKDNAGNIASPITKTLEVPADTVKPTIEEATVEGTKVTFKFSEELQLQGLANAGTVEDYAKVTLGNGTPVYLKATNQDAKDKTKFTYDFATSVTGDFLNSTVKVEGFKDVAGNAGEAFTKSVALAKDKAAPKFESAFIEDNNIVLKFDKAVANNSIAYTDLSVKYTDKDGVLQTGSITTIGTVVAGYDVNGNGDTDDAGEANYLVIPVTAANFVVSNKIVEGDYTITLAANKVKDTNTTANVLDKAITATAKVEASKETKAIVELSRVAQSGTDNSVLTVTFNNDMDSSALDLANYTLGGTSLAGKGKAVFVGNKKNVQITLNENVIAANGDQVLAVKDLKDKDGNTLKVGKTTKTIIGLKENVLPTAKSVSIVDDKNVAVTFSEALATLPSSVTNVTVKVNGTKIALDTTTPFVLDSTAKVLTIKAKDAATIKATDKITVEFENTNLTDKATNKVKDASISNK